MGDGDNDGIFGHSDGSRTTASRPGAVKSQIQSLPGIIRARLGRGEASAVARDAAPPDSALATNALEFLEELYPASLFHHCLRC
jgi:hypothetical protein